VIQAEGVQQAHHTWPISMLNTGPAHPVLCRISSTHLWIIFDSTHDTRTCRV